MTKLDAVNLDATSAVTFISEGSPTRGLLKKYVAGRPMLMCHTAQQEFSNILRWIAGPLEAARGRRLLSRVTIVPDNPSARAAALRPTHNLDAEDIIILGTGDALGVATMTADAKSLRAAAAQGVVFTVFPHTSIPLTKR